MKTIVITMGDPEGIGPELIVKSFKRISPSSDFTYKLFVERDALENQGAAELYNRADLHFSFLNEDFKTELAIDDECSQTRSGAKAYACLSAAIDFIKANPGCGLVTAPVSKDRLKKAGFAFSGHTDFLAHAFNASDHAMMLFHEKLKVVLVTTHVPYKDVPEKINQEEIVKKIAMTVSSLQNWFKIKHPKIAVCGLNPHSGEHGLLGDEEINIITPAIEQAGTKIKNASIQGPFAADTVFMRAIKGDFDAVVCMYHDQGLVAVKTTGFDEGVNLTLGLPFVRTSPDHGTAFDIAGKDLANPESFLQAIQWAKKLD